MGLFPLFVCFYFHEFNVLEKITTYTVYTSNSEWFTGSLTKNNTTVLLAPLKNYTRFTSFIRKHR